MKTKIRFQKVRLEELQALLPEAALDGHDRRNSDGANALKTVKKRAAKPANQKAKR